MNFLRRYLGRAKIVPVNRHESSDKNEYNTVDRNCDSESSEEEHVRDPFNEYMVKMINFVRELAIFCFIFMAYAAITSDPPKVSKAPAAYPFFSKDSPVKDFYRGQIVSAIEHARTTDLSFIMFYAPWDAESQAAMKEFEEAANLLKDNVVFAAVNCWQPGSECRNQYNKVYRWPVLIAYPTFGSGIQYNGPISAPYMISFLQKLMKPVKRAGDQIEILDFNEAFVVAEINARPKSLEYSVFYLTALKYLEADPLSRVDFFVKPVKNTQNKLLLYLWDQVRVMEIEPGKWKIDAILSWILKTAETASSKVLPTGSKSLLLSNFLQPGPSLVLFTPNNPFNGPGDYYMMFQEIAQEYKNCDDLTLNFDMKSKRLAYLLEHKHLQETCHLKQSFLKPKKFPPITTNVAFLDNMTRLRPPAGEKIELDCNTLGLDTKILNVCQNVKMGECFDVLPQLPKIFDNDGSEKSEEKGTLSHNSYLYKTSMLNSDSDPKSMENLRKIMHKAKCKNFLAAQKLLPPIMEPKSAQNVEKLNVAGLACANQSLEFVALDSLMYHTFAERLGIDLFKKSDKSAAVIINEKMEVHYIMEEPITNQNLRKFIKKFTNNTLSRSLLSSIDVHSKNTPSYTIKANRDFNVPIMYVEELNSRNFLATVLEEDKAVVVMYYSKQCSYCNGISYTLLTLARKLAFVENLEFYRIDGDLNILPWMYTMEQFPTILFFPANRKEETRVFPSDLPINVPNLLGFILTNVDPPTKLHAMYSICIQNQLNTDKNACLLTVRNETISLIEQSLKIWRKSNNRHRQLLLYNLRQLRHLQFLFNHSPEDYRLIDSYFKKLNAKLSGDYNLNSTKRTKEEL